MRLQARANLARSTAVATAVLQVRIGGSDIFGATFNSNVNQQWRVDSNMEAVTSASQLTENWNPPNAQATNAFANRSVDMTAARAFTIELSSANAADSFTLLSYSLTLYP